MACVIDTNVLIAANGKECPQATLECQLACIHKLQFIEKNDALVIDNKWHILQEYMKKVSPSGQPGVGDAFLKWVLQNQGNCDRCQQVSITQTLDGSFEEFPTDPDLIGFDLSDHKFVATALVHPQNPPILNALDSDWRHFEFALLAVGITVQQLCPETLK